MTTEGPPADHASCRFLVAGVQMPVALAGGNVAAMLGQIARAALLFPGLDMIVFSELAPHGPAHASASATPQEDEALFQAAAARHGIWVVPGSALIAREGRLFNHAIVIDPAGTIVGRYDKLFPFQPFEAGVSGGTDLLIWDIAGVGRFGLSICYDIWFPETTRAMTSAGVEVLLHPVLTGTTDRAVELAIVQATAAMFQCYVVDVNGLDGGGIGRSLVADPAGRVIHQCGQATELFPITLDLGLVRHVRRNGADGLGQVLKSWRDRSARAALAGAGAPAAYLETLGPLAAMPRHRRSG